MQAVQRQSHLVPLWNQQQYRHFVYGHGHHDSQLPSGGVETQLLLDLQLGLSRKLQRQVGLQQRMELVMKLRQQLLPMMAWQVVGRVADARQPGRRSCAA